MGREVRMVPPDWEHPKKHDGSLLPLLKGYAADKADFLQRLASDGYESATAYWGGAPVQEHYMPVWPKDEATHFIMYENTSEGTPISPAFATPEELARWLADNGASAFGYSTATYEQWLSVCKDGYAPSAVITAKTGLISGVEAAERLAREG